MSDSHNNNPDEEIKQGLVSDFMAFLKEEKIWWILPLVIILGLFALIAFAGQSAGPLAPFIYPFA